MQTRLKQVFAFILVCLPGFLVAQQNVQHRADSLLAKLAKTTSDTTKVNLLNDLSDVYYDNPTESKNYGEKALKLSEKIKWNKGRIASYNSLAQAALTANDYKTSIGYAKLGLQISEQMHGRAGSGEFYFSLGVCYDAMKDIPQAINAFNSAIKYLPEESPLFIIALDQLGAMYASLNNYEQAIDYYLKAKKIADKSNNVNTKSLASFFLRNMYGNLQEYKKALTYALEFRKYAEQQNQKPATYGALENIGYLYDKLKDFDNALVYYNKALAVATELNNPAYKAAAKAGLAWEYYQMGDYARAYPAAKESLDLPLQETARQETYNTLGNILKDAPDSLLEKHGIKPGDKYQQAISYFLRSNKSKSVTTRQNNYRDMSIAYERMGKPREAYDSYKHYIAMRDSMDIAGHQATVSQKEIQFDYIKREDSIKYAQNLTNEKLKQERLLATQRQQALLLNAQQLSLANKQKDIERLNYLKSRVSLQASQKERALAQTTVQLQRAEIRSKRYQSYYFLAGLAILLLLAGFIGLNYYNQRKSNRLLSEANGQITRANNELSEKQEEITTQRDRLAETINELKSTQTQLIQSEKMASLGELTAGIAHEIQNPLNFVNNFSEVNIEMLDELNAELKNGNVEEAMAIAADMRHNEEKIRHHGKRADGIVKGMLEHSRTSTGQKEPTDLNKLADEYLRLAYHGVRANDKTFNAGLITNFDPNLPPVNIIPQDIGRVLLNLFNNAFYAVQQKQLTAGDGYKPVIEVITKINGQQAELTIKDNGTGIPDAIKEKIMQPFFTTKPTGQGTGLGLSLSYDIIVKGHGGNIAVNSTAGEGSEFIIQVPSA